MDYDFTSARMILSGISLDEPYLQHRLSILMKEEKKSLQAGKLPVTESYYLMGTVDPTGILKSNEVCIILYVCSLIFGTFLFHYIHFAIFDKWLD